MARGVSFWRAIAGAALFGFAVSNPLGWTSLGVLYAIGAAGSGLLMSAMPRPSIDTEREGILTQAASTTAMLPRVYGDSDFVRVAGRLAYLNTRNRGRNQPNDVMALVTCFALGPRARQEGEPPRTVSPTFPNPDVKNRDGIPLKDLQGVDRIRRIYFDERLAVDLGAVQIRGRYSISPLFDLVKVWGLYSGDGEPEANETLIAQLEVGDWLYDDVWTANHRLQGICNAVLAIAFHAEELAALPNITARLRGDPVLDTGVGLWLPSRNPAWSIRDYLLDEISGARLRLAQINEASFRYFAGFSERLVIGPERSYLRATLDGPTDPAQSVQDNLRRMLSTAPAGLDWSSGQYHLRVRDEGRAPIYHFDETNTVDGWRVWRSTAEETANTLIGRFVDAGETADDEPKDQVDEIVYPDDETFETNPYLDEDSGFHVERTMEFPFSTEKERVRLRLSEEIEFLRKSQMAAFRASIACLKCAIYDPVTITKPKLGWFQKEFIIMDMGINFPTRDVTVTVRERSQPPVLEIPVPEPVELLGQPFDIIEVEGTETRPPAVWVTLPFARLEDVCIAVVDYTGAIEHLQDPQFPGATGNMSYWAEVYVPPTNEVWCVNQSGGTRRIYVFNATTRGHDETRTYNTGSPHGLIQSSVYDMRFHAPTLSVIVATATGVYRVSAIDGVVNSGPLKTSGRPHRIAGLTPHVSVASDLRGVIPITDSLWAAVSGFGYVWYFNPTTMTEMTGAFIDGPIGGLGDTGGDWINQGIATGPDMYDAPYTHAPLHRWIQGANNLAPPNYWKGVVEEPGKFMHTERAVMPDGSLKLIASFGSGTALIPGSAGGCFADGIGYFNADFHGGRLCNLRQLNWIALASFWRSTTHGGPARVVQFFPLGALPDDAPEGAPPGPEPPIDFPDDDDFDPPDEGPDDPGGDPDPTQPEGEAPTLALENWCDDDVTGSGPYDGTIRSGWEATITPQGTGSEHPHEIVGFAVGADPEVATPQETLKIAAPQPGQQFTKILYERRGPWNSVRPSCAGFVGGESITRDYYLRRHRAGFAPGPVSNKVTLTIKDPAPDVDDTAPGGTPGTATVKASPGGCRVNPRQVGSGWKSGVRVWNLITASPGTDEAIPIEVAEMEQGEHPDTHTPISRRTETPRRTPFLSSPYKIREEFDVWNYEVSSARSQDVPECGKPQTAIPPRTRDYYARERRSTGPGPWSLMARTTAQHPGPRGGFDESAEGKFPPVIALEGGQTCEFQQTDSNPTAWRGTVNTYRNIRVTKPEGSPHSGIVFYFMNPGEHPDTHAPAAELGSFGRQSKAMAPPENNQSEVLSCRLMWTAYNNPQPAKPVCGAGSTTKSYDTYARSEGATFGDSAWSNMVVATVTSPTDPV